MAISLSVNLNKVALLRNSRGGTNPSPKVAGKTCLDAGAYGLTLHWRHDNRHTRAEDVRVLRALCAERGAEFNLEGDDREERRTRRHVGDVVARGEGVEGERRHEGDDHQDGQCAVLLEQGADPVGAAGAGLLGLLDGPGGRRGHGGVRVRGGHRFPRPRAA